MADLVEALQWGMEVALSDLNTAMPGRLVSYDPATNRATVRPALPKRLASGEELAAPAVMEVPVAWTAGGGASLTFPLKPGDGVLLLFAQRSLEGWLSGNDAAPDDPRRFALSDAVALPGLRARGLSGDPEAVVLAWDGGTLRLEPGGTARLAAPRLIVEGDVEVTGDVTAGSVSLRQHVHLNTQPGTGTSGPPRP